MTGPDVLPRGATRRVLTDQLRGRRTVFVRIAGWSVLEALPALTTGVALANAIDEGFGRNRPLVGFAHLALLAVAYVVSGQATRRIYPLIGAVVEPVRDGLVERVVTGMLVRAGSGRAVVDASAVSRMTQQVETVRDVLAGLLLIARRTVFGVVAAVIGLAALGSSLLAPVLPPLGAALVIFAMLVPAQLRRQRAQVMCDEQVAGTTGQMITGLRDVVAFRAQHHVIALGDRTFAQQLSAVRALAGTTAARTATVAVGAYLPVVLLLLATPSLLQQGVTAGAVVGAITYVIRTLEPTLRSLTLTIGGSALRMAVALRRIAEMSVVSGSPPAPPVVAPAPAGVDIHLRDVTFRYGPDVEPVLQGLDLRIGAGSHWAVVGPSGIGKSTLAGLLGGLEEPQHGEVLLGGSPLARHHRLVTLVPQESYVFAGSLRDNLCYLRPDAAEADLHRVVHELDAGPLVARCGGYDAQLMPGALDAAERQLIALVRAHLSTAPVIVLDEATCHLDPTAEAAVERVFAAREGTLVVIAHRMSSARRADHVLLMDGDVVAAGTHQSLLASSVTYAELVGWWENRPSQREDVARASV
ncbi:ATP-binding cassette domain-containing protein [Pseudonocardia sp. TRM90224]|uniref:ATP-binding cassette domain-containing protein n=1 Tax=Pseudonocardia sp. TRM90224 TaxID=2812678 RepID=UPI001E628759|nr:ABC transporter ATP-binding protein [Pseudonocardia sp. TRM90224]